MKTFKEFLFDLFESEQNYDKNLERIYKTLKKYNVEYMFIGRGAAIMQGFPESTQDVDIYPKKDTNNFINIIKALVELGFDINKDKKNDIMKGKDFIQFDEPFELDLVFSPDGFENYQSAVKYKKTIEGKPVMSVEGVIISKKAANRIKDKLSIKNLEDFNDWLKQHGKG